jgi:ubiquitin C-terminal hydrolase
MTNQEVVDYWKVRGRRGLVNVGCTCYINTAIQCLFNNITLLKLFLSLSLDSSTQPLCYELQSLLRVLWIDNKHCVPKRWCSVLQSSLPDLEIFTQNDIHEFMTLLVDKLGNELRFRDAKSILDIECKIQHCNTIIQTTKNKLEFFSAKMDRQWWEDARSPLHAMSPLTFLFQGQMIAQVKCDNCNSLSHTTQPFTTLPITIMQNEKSSLEMLFNKSMESETIADYKCDKCKVQTSAVRTVRFWRMPEFMILYLKRFTYDGRKIQSDVDVPETFDMSEYMIGPHTTHAKQYKLVSIACHVGSQDNGHYYAVCKHPSESEWVIYDDDDVKTITTYSNIQSRHYYLLVYQNSVI